MFNNLLCLNSAILTLNLLSLVPKFQSNHNRQHLIRKDSIIATFLLTAIYDYTLSY